MKNYRKVLDTNFRNLECPSFAKNSIAGGSKLQNKKQEKTDP